MSKEEYVVTCTITTTAIVKAKDHAEMRAEYIEGTVDEMLSTYGSRKEHVEYIYEVDGVKVDIWEKDSPTRCGRRLLITNEDRANTIKEFMEANSGWYVDDGDNELLIRDLLTNVMHLCQQEGIGFDNELRRAENFFREEIDSE